MRPSVFLRARGNAMPAPPLHNLPCKLLSRLEMGLNHESDGTLGPHCLTNNDGVACPERDGIRGDSRKDKWENNING